MPTNYVHFTEEQKEQARSTDLVSFLRSRGETLKRSGSEYQLKNNGAKVTVRGNLWFNQYEREGGDAIDFVQRFYNLDFPEAVQLLLGSQGIPVISQNICNSAKSKEEFALPPANENMHRVYAYLLKQRFIDRDIISFFAHSKLLYEDAEYHNAVFVGCDENEVPQHAHKRGTYSASGYKGNISGSNPNYSFHHIGISNKLYVFESPIDMLSFLSLYKENWRHYSYAALCCTAPNTVEQILKNNSQIDTVITCLDHDKAGIEGNFRVAEAVNRLGKYRIYGMQPKYKDWNEILKSQHGIEPLPANEHHGLEKMKILCQRLIDECQNQKCIHYPLDELRCAFDKLKGMNPSDTNTLTEQSLHTAEVAFLFAQKQATQLNRTIKNNELLRLYEPHHDNGSYKSHLLDIEYRLRDLSRMFSKDEILTETEVFSRIKNTLQLSIDCLRLIHSAELNQEIRRADDQCPVLQV